MAHRPVYRVLFFINGPVPTEEQRDECEQYGAHASFRNALFVPKDGGALEPCVAVAGEVPAAYRKVYPMAVSYEAWRRGELGAPPKPAEVPTAPRALPSLMGARPHGLEPRPMRADRQTPIDLPAPPGLDPFAAGEAATAGAGPTWNSNP